MTQEQSLRDEIARLNDEVTRLKLENPASNAKPPARPRVRTPSRENASPDTASKAAEDASADDTNCSEAKSIKDLTKELTTLLDDAEDQISAHPMTAVLGAFAIGIVVGGILRR